MKPTKSMVDFAVVDAGTNVMGALTDTGQRKLFYVNGLWWVFWGDKTNILYSTSPNGTSWSSQTIFRAGKYGDRLGMYYDGVYIHYAFTTTNAGEDVFYRRGILNANATISWSDSEQVVYDTLPGNTTWVPDVTVDSSGYPFVTYRRRNSSERVPFVSKSSLNNGTWQTDAGFPYQLSSTDGYWYPLPESLSNDRIYVAYCYANYNFRGRLWNGSAWGNEENIAAMNAKNGLGSTVTFRNNLYLAFQTAAPYTYRVYKRTYDVGWDSGTDLGSVSSGNHIPSLTLIGNDRLVVFHYYSGVTSYLLYVDGVVSSWQSWVTNSQYGLCLQSTYSVTSNNDVGYANNNPSDPFQIYFAYLEVVNIFPLLLVSDGSLSGIRDRSYELSFTVLGSTGNTSTTTIYSAGRGAPGEVTGVASYSYDSGSDVLTVTVTHSSDEVVVIRWGSAIPSNVVAGYWVIFQASFTMVALVGLVAAGSFVMIAMSGEADLPALVMVVSFAFAGVIGAIIVSLIFQAAIAM